MILWINWLSYDTFSWKSGKLSFVTFKRCKEIDPEIEFMPKTMADSNDPSGFVYVGF